MKIDKIYTKNVHDQVTYSVIATVLMFALCVASYFFRERITNIPLFFFFFVFLFFFSDLVRALVDLKNLEK